MLYIILTDTIGSDDMQTVFIWVMWETSLVDTNSVTSSRNTWRHLSTDSETDDFPADIMLVQCLPTVFVAGIALCQQRVDVCVFWVGLNMYL